MTTTLKTRPGSRRIESRSSQTPPARIAASLVNQPSSQGATRATMRMSPVETAKPIFRLLRSSWYASSNWPAPIR